MTWTDESRQEAGSLRSESILSTWWCLPAVVCLSLNLFLSVTRGSLDGHEVLVAQTAREMLRSNDWIHPTLAGSPRYQKPPLAYWLAGTAYQLTGNVSVLTARLPSLLAALLLTLLTAYGVKWKYGVQAARCAGLMQATMFWSLNYGSSAIVDMTLSLVVAIGIFSAAADGLSIPVFRPAMILLFWMMAGLSVLAKGPLGVAIILSTGILCRISFSRGRSDTAPRFFVTWWTIPGLLCFALLSCGWGAAVLWTEPNVIELWREQSFGRFLIHWGPQTRPWYYYLYQVPLLTLPWAPLWMVELYSIVRERVRGQAIDNIRWLSLIWFGVTILLLSLSEGKREHYILPGMVPLTILAALGGIRLTRRLTSGHPQPLMAVAVGAIVVAVIGVGSYEWVREDEIESLANEVNEHRELIDAAPMLVQYGSNEHASCFILDRSMKWCGAWGEVESIVGQVPDSMLLVPATRVDEVLARGDWKPISEHDSAKSKRTLILLTRSSD